MHPDMEFWSEVRRLMLTNPLSRRAAHEKYKLGWGQLKKILTHDEPPAITSINRGPSG